MWYFPSLIKEMSELIHSSRYSRRAKQLLQSYDIHPPPRVIEVDLRGWSSFAATCRHVPDTLLGDGNILKTLLTRLTGHSTFPNVIIKGKSIGGSDNLMSLHANKELRAIIEKAGAEAREDGLDV